MQDNEFEKQVHQKLAQMQMEASDTVWQRVEDGLDGKRKRRRWFILLPLGAAGVLLFALFYMNAGSVRQMVGISKDFTAEKSGLNHVDGQKNYSGIEVDVDDSANKRTESIATTPLENREISADRKSPLKEARKKPAFTPDFRSTGSDQSSNYAKANTNKSNSASEKNALSDRKIITTTGPTYKQNAWKRRENIRSQSNTADQNRNVTNTEQKVFEESANRKSLGKNTAQKGIGATADQNSIGKNNTQKAIEATADRNSTGENNAKNAPEEIARDNPQQNINGQIQREIMPGLIKTELRISNFFSTDSAIKNLLPGIVQPPAKLITAQSGWRFGITVGAGRSGITTGKFNTLFYSDAASVPNYSAGNLGNSVVVVRPSQINPGLSLSIGTFAERQLESNIYIKAGLQFSRFTTTMQVGRFQAQSIVLRSTQNMADKSIVSYYTGERNQRYVNAYSYLDIPVSLGVNFASKTRFPFAWEFGLAPSILLGTNALHFNQGSSIYYKDNSLFKKSQMAFVTALPVKLYNGYKYALILSPNFRYNTSDLFRPEMGERKHMLVAGAGLSLQLKK